jgi:hypothetical protein
MALEIPKKESDNKNSIPTPAEVDDSLDKEYIDKRTITISMVHNYSNYRKVNMKVLGQKKETIGSSIRSCQILSSNRGEVEAYFPALIGLSPNNPDFISRVKAWLSNIQFVVNNNDVTLNTSFIYNKKSDYLEIQKREDAIDDEYAKVDRANTAAIKEALKKKIDALNALESTKYKYGRPENLEEYLMYRHCLLYKDVAKDSALINSDPSIRFFIKDATKEAERQKKLVAERVKAMKEFIELNATDAKFDAVYMAVCIAKSSNLTEAMLKDRNQKAAVLMDYVNNNPDKFNKIVNDKKVTIKSFIETLILRGELIRSDFNQQISTADGTFVGANMNEAIAWFENPDNKDIRSAYENKLKLS